MPPFARRLLISATFLPFTAAIISEPVLPKIKKTAWKIKITKLGHKKVNANLALTKKKFFGDAR